MLISARKYKDNISKEKSTDLPNKIITYEDMTQVAIETDIKSIKSFVSNKDYDKLVLKYKDFDIDVDVIIDNDDFMLCNFSYSGVVFFKGILWFTTMEALSRNIKVLTKFFSENLSDYVRSDNT